MRSSGAKRKISHRVIVSIAGKSIAYRYSNIGCYPVFINRPIRTVAASMLPTLTVPAIDSQERTVETLIHVLRLVLTVGQTAGTVSLVATSFSLTNLQRCSWSGCGCLASARYGATSRRWR
ncbi:hypothetical protein IG631_07037 [Alternaria alternata]|nr:hypothetical protein IG631_07037 [Alternaria alternata]